MNLLTCLFPYINISYFVILIFGPWSFRQYLWGSYNFRLYYELLRLFGLKYFYRRAKIWIWFIGNFENRPIIYLPDKIIIFAYLCFQNLSWKDNIMIEKSGAIIHYFVRSRKFIFEPKLGEIILGLNIFVRIFKERS